MNSQYSVLFVDDDIHILNAIRRGLIDEDYRCFFAESGRDALEILRLNNIGVIVTDMRMPQMDGLTLLKEVKKRHPNIVKIVLSGYTQLQQILATINNVDIFKFITKPWKMEDEFKVIIRQALEYYKYLIEKENSKNSLEIKNQAYQNIFKNIDHTILSVRGALDLFGNVALGALDLIGDGGVTLNESSDNTGLYINKDTLNLRIQVVSRLLQKILVYANEECRVFNVGVLIDDLANHLKTQKRELDIESKIKNNYKIITNYSMIYGFLLEAIQLISDELEGIYVKLVLQNDSSSKDGNISINIFHKEIESDLKANSLTKKEEIARLLSYIIGSTLRQINCEYVCKVINGILIQKIIFVNHKDELTENKAEKE